MWYFLLAVFLLIIAGFLKQLYDTNNLSKDFDNVMEYSETFADFIKELTNEEKFNQEKYNILISKSDEVQIILGGYGLVDIEEHGRIYHDYPLLLNFIPKTPEFSKNRDMFELQNFAREVNWVQNSFSRYLNSIKNIVENYKRKIFNPFICLTEGIKYTLSIPISILFWLGIISEKRKNKLEVGLLMKLFSGATSLLTILSTIMSVFLGWDKFVQIVCDIFSK